MTNPVEIRKRSGGYLTSDRKTAAPRRFEAIVHFVGGKLFRVGKEWPTGHYVGPGGITGEGGLRVSLDIELGDDGKPLCRRLEVQPEPPSQEAITTLASRIPLFKLMKLALAWATVEIGEPNESGEQYAVHRSPPEIDADFANRHRKGARGAHRGLELTDADYRKVADIYRGAKNKETMRRKPRRAVAMILGVSDSTAARRIREARRRGFLED